MLSADDAPVGTRVRVRTWEDLCANFPRQDGRAEGDLLTPHTFGGSERGWCGFECEVVAVEDGGHHGHAHTKFDIKCLSGPHEGDTKGFFANELELVYPDLNGPDLVNWIKKERHAT